MKQLLGLFILFNSAVMAAPIEAVDIITVYGSDLVTLDGDEAEVDLNDDDDFTYLSLDAAKVKGVRWAHIVPFDNSPGAGRQRFPFYIDYSTIDIKSDDGKTHSDKYQSLTVGFAIQGILSTESRVLDTYFGLFAGGGASRFSLDEPEYKAVGEIAGEYGIIVGNRFSFGVGIKHQVIGYPGETMADVWQGTVNAGIWF